MYEPPVFLSIITPVYDGAMYIKKCIHSVQEQMIEDYEHLIVDGVSKDDTVAIVERFKEKDKHIRLVSEKDTGVYDAMNKGIAMAKGKWLFFLGADDYFFSSEVLKQVLERLRKTNTDMLYGNVWHEKIGRLYDGRFTIEKLLKRNICHQGIFYNSAAFRVLGKYTLLFSKEADYDLNLRFWLHGLTTEYAPVTIAFFSSGGISSTRDEKFIEAYPATTSKYLMEGNRNFLEKIIFQAAIFRKVLQRYPIRYFKDSFRNQGSAIIKLASIFWLLISFPFYLVISFIFGRK